MEEKELIEKCLINNRRAQYELFKKYEGYFLFIVKRYVGNREEAEDVLQEGFIRIFSSLKNYRFEVSFNMWARKIIIRASIDYLRKKKNLIFSFSELSQKEEELLLNLTEKNFLFEDKNKKIPKEYLFEIVKNLHPARRTVFNMYAIDGYKHKEIAKILNISEGTSKLNLFKARAVLVEQIDKFLRRNNF